MIISLEEGLNHVVELLVGLGNGVRAVDVLDEGGKTGTTVHDSLLDDRNSGLLVVVREVLVEHEV